MRDLRCYALALVSAPVVTGLGWGNAGEGRKAHAWFISFAPANDPKIAVAVIAEDGGVAGSEAGGGTVAAPIAKQMMEARLNR